MSMVTTRSSQGTTMDDIKQDIRELSVNLDKKMDKLEASMTDRIKGMVTDLIDAMRQEMIVKLASLEERIATLESQPPPQNGQELANNFVVYGIAEVADGVEENVTERVNTLLAGELQLVDVQVTSAERKPKFNNYDCGVIVAKCVNFADKQKIMEAKSRLRESAHFSHIRIIHDKPKWQRQHEANLRLVVKTLRTNKLYVRGSRVCLTDEREMTGTIRMGEVKLVVEVEVEIVAVVQVEVTLEIKAEIRGPDKLGGDAGFGI